MIHQIGLPLPRLAKIDPVGPGGGGHLVRGPGQTDRVLGKGRIGKISLELGRPVALRINTYEDNLQVLGAGSQLFPGKGQALQGRRADIRAIGEAEKDNAPAALQDIFADHPPILIDQTEGPTGQGLGAGGEQTTGPTQTHEQCQGQCAGGGDDQMLSRHGFTLVRLALLADALSMAQEGQSAPQEPLDRQSPAPSQDGLAWGGSTSGVWTSRLRLRTLTTQRWIVIGVELVVLIISALIFDLKAPYVLCFGVVAIAAWINLLTAIASPGQRLLNNLEASSHLGFDLLQVTALLLLAGGAANPFMVLLIAPVTMAAATLPLRSVLALGALATACILALSLFHGPLPSSEGNPLDQPHGYLLAAAIACLAGIGIVAGNVRQAAQESARMGLALDVTQTVLAREQRLSALGALAAAAAHELGTPLATISIVAKELAREAPNAMVKEDADLLIAQAERCREILRRLTETPAAATDELHERMSLLQLVHEVIEPHSKVRGVRVEAIVTGAPGVRAPDIWRMPEVLHALTSFVENAVDFATSEVLITARFDLDRISMEVRDDGPGFSADVLSKLGEPYVTTRQGVAGGRTGHVGMGLGFFIAKTLLERTGAVVTFQNARPRGAVISARWPRARIETPARNEFQGL